AEVMKRLLESKSVEEPWMVHVRPTVLVEAADNEIQRSPRYESGFALRFARIARLRDDQEPAEADTYERLNELYPTPFERKGKNAEEIETTRANHHRPAGPGARSVVVVVVVALRSPADSLSRIAAALASAAGVIAAVGAKLRSVKRGEQAAAPHLTRDR